MVEESGGSVGIRGGGAGRGGGMRQVGRPGMVPGRGGGGSELLGAGSLGGGGLGNSYASEATRVAAALAGKMPKEVRPAGGEGMGKGRGWGKRGGGEGREETGEKNKEEGGGKIRGGEPRGEGEAGELRQSWQARRNIRRRGRRKSRQVREARSRDEFLEYLGAQWWERKKQAAEAEERERGCSGEQARGVQAMMTLIVIGTVQGGEREGAPLGSMKRGVSGGRQPEEEEERKESQ